MPDIGRSIAEMIPGGDSDNRKLTGFSDPFQLAPLGPSPYSESR